MHTQQVFRHFTYMEVFPTWDYSRPRRDNSGDPNITAVWNSQIPSTCFFVTVFNSDIMPFGNNIIPEFPDTCMMFGAVCMQSVIHRHVVLCTQNQYSWDAAVKKLMRVFKVGRHDIRVAPVYTTIQRCVDYIKSQAVVNEDGVRVEDYSALYDEEFVPQLDTYGNMWLRVHGIADDFNNGLTAFQAFSWCMYGFPLYVLAGVQMYKHAAASEGNSIWCSHAHGRRLYYNEAVIPLSLDKDKSDGMNACNIVSRKLEKFFGVCTSSVAFIADISRSPLDVDIAMSSYAGQPGIVLYCSNKKKYQEDNKAIAELMASRAGPFYNLEVLVIVQ